MDIPVTSEAIQYVFFNMDTLQFVIDEKTLTKEIGRGGTLRAIVRYPNGVLMAGSGKTFEQSTALYRANNAWRRDNERQL